MSAVTGKDKNMIPEQTTNLPETREELMNRYWLKSQLAAICGELGLPRTGSKEELAGFICDHLEHKPVTRKPHARAAHKSEGTITPDMLIDPAYANDEKHRAFFRREIGDRFRFNVPFMDWMKAHRGTRTYREAIDEWKRLETLRKGSAPRPIGKQFQYNRYTRDFFADNPGRSRADCIACWNYKKNRPGSHAYERDDLRILDSGTPGRTTEKT